MLASSIWFTRGVYLFYTTGSCNGVNASGFCVFDPTGQNNQVSTLEKCTTKPAGAAGLSLEGVDTSTFPVLNPASPKNIVMIGCYHCDFSRKAYPMIRQMADRYNVGLTFLHYPVKEDTDYFSRLSYTVYQLAPEKYWAFNDLMFAGDESLLDDPAHIEQMLSGLGLDPKVILSVADDPLTGAAVKKQMSEVVKTGFYGTPTIFIADDVFVGPKPYRVYAIALEGLLYWLK
jgi:protein-disulfide isomerase